MDTQIVIIPKGTSICPSEKGHNNFYYPKLNKCIIISEDIEVKRLHWIGGGDLSAYKKLNSQIPMVSLLTLQKRLKIKWPKKHM